MLFSLCRERRIRRSGEYRRVYGGRRIVGRYLILFCLGAESVRVGITVSRKVGGACERNRVKRRLREILRVMSLEMLGGVELVFVARMGAKKAGFDELKRDVETLIDRVGR